MAQARKPASRKMSWKKWWKDVSRNSLVKFCLLEQAYVESGYDY